MAFFDKVKQGLDAASKKTSEVIEVQKLNSSIRSEKNEIDEIFRQIGKSSFERYGANGTGDEDFIGFFQSIQQRMVTITDLEQKLDEVRNLKECPSCKFEQPREVLFCSKCGFRFDEQQQEPPQE